MTAPTPPRSPAAQAIRDAYKTGGLEAALIAAADQVVPEVKSPGGCREGERQCVRREIFALAAELKR
jgi:hypothetical protein